MNDADTDALLMSILMLMNPTQQLTQYPKVQSTDKVYILMKKLLRNAFSTLLGKT